MKKAIIISVLLSMLIGGLSGCGEKGAVNEESAKPSAEATTEETISASESAAEDDFYIDGDGIYHFSMTLLSGDTVSLSDFRGKKVLVNFWATWCGPCVNEMPAFQRLTEEFPDDVAILAVNCSEETSEVQNFVDTNGYTFTVVLDSDAALQSFFGGIQSIPQTFVFDESGILVNSHTGASDEDSMYEMYKEELGL